MSKLSITVHGDTAADLKTNLGLALASLGGTAAPAAPAAKPAAAPAPKPAAAPAPKPAAAPKPAPKPAAAPAPAAPAEGEVTLNSLREQGRACIKAGKNAEMKAALTELGADSITTMDPAQYGALAEKLNAILNPSASDDLGGEGSDAL